MHDMYQSRIATRGLLLIAFTTGLTACTSLDPKADLDRAKTIALPRLDVDVDATAALARHPEDAPNAWDGTTPIDIDSAVLTAFQRDAHVRAALENVAMRRAMLVQAELPPNPVVGFGVGIAIDGLSGAPAMVQVLQQLSWLWKRPHMIDAANAERRTAILAAAEHAVSLSARVQKAFASVLEMQRRIELDSSYATITSETLRVVQLLADAGESSRIGLNLAALEHAEAHAALLSSQKSLLEAKLNLLSEIGLPDFSTEWSAAGEFDLSADVPEENEIVERARIVRLDVARAVEALEIAVAESKLAGTRRIPEVGVGLGWQQSFSRRRALVPGASISIPILDDGSAGISAADAGVRIAALDLLQVRRDAVSEARTTLVAWQQSDEQATLYKETVLQPAIEAQELSVKAYSEGVVDLTVVLISQQRRIEAERRMLKYQAAATIDLVTLEQAVGGSFKIPIEAPEALDTTNEEKTS
jgi:outer membrane protein TolC